MNEGENVAMVFAQQLAQVRPARRVTLIRVPDRTTRSECFRDLIIQFDAVGHHDERPIPWHLAQNLLRIKHHGIALTAALRLPEYAAATVPSGASLERGRDCVVHAEKLMILPDDLYEPGLVLGIERKILNQIQQTRFVASATNYCFQRNLPRFILALDSLPFEEAFPICRQRADAAFCAVGSNQHRIVPKQCRDSVLRMFVAGAIVIERLASGDTWLFELQQNQRKSIHETDDIRTAGV